jgi:hypothetical protein
MTSFLASAPEFHDAVPWPGLDICLDDDVQYPSKMEPSPNLACLWRATAQQISVTPAHQQNGDVGACWFQVSTRLLITRTL